MNKRQEQVDLSKLRGFQIFLLSTRTALFTRELQFFNQNFKITYFTFLIRSSISIQNEFERLKIKIYEIPVDQIDVQACIKVSTSRT